MRIYGELSADAIIEAGRAEGMWVQLLHIRRTRIRKHGWHASTEGTSKRPKNSGTFGASHLYAASWDQHGRWFARLFQYDPNAVIVGVARYDGAEDFHAQTNGKYRIGG